MTYMSALRTAGFALCGLAAAPVFAQTLTVSAEAQAVFDLAEELYPEVFVGASDLREAAGYVYRFYADTGVYVGIKNNEISLLGGPFGSSIVSKGSITTVLDFLQDTKADVTVTPTADMNALFELAAEFQPSVFGTGTAVATDAQGYLYRYYEDSGVYAAIKDGLVYLRGGVFGTFYTSRGALNNVIASLEEQVNGNPNPNPTPIPEGDYTLTVTGTVSGTTTAAGMSFPIPATGVNLTITDMPAPNTADLESIKKTFLDTVKDVEGLVVTNASVVIINNTANLIEFTMAVSATLTSQGATSNFTYDLRYKYVK